jgi:putative membrane protein
VQTKGLSLEWTRRVVSVFGSGARKNETQGGLTVAASLAGLPDFLIFFVIAVALVGLYLAIYTLATMHNEFALIRENVISAATALGFSLVGFALPLASAIVHAQTIVDCLVWGLVALAVQIIVYWLVRIAMPNLSQRIAGGEMAAALFLGAASLAAGIINAAAMTF